MKRSDLAMIILIASFSMLGAYFVAKTVLGDTQNKAEKVKTIDAISAEVNTPEERIFNKDAINPTVEVFIGNEG